MTQNERPNIKKYTLKDNKAGPWEDAINFHGYCGYKRKKNALEESSDVPWMRKMLSPKPQYPFAVTPVPFLSFMVFVIDLRP